MPIMTSDEYLEDIVLEFHSRLSLQVENLKTYFSHWLPFLASPADQLKLAAPPLPLKEGESAIPPPEAPNPLPPIHRLPNEVLIAIFTSELSLVYGGDEPWAPQFPRRSLVTGKKLNPTTLGEVCRHWRAVTLFTPLLWSSLSVLCNLEESTLPILALWLERSAGLPLDITFIETTCEVKHDARDFYYKPPKNPMTPAVMELLVSQAHRWRSIDFQFSLQISEVLLNAPAESFQMLESAQLRSRKATNARFDGVAPIVKAWELFHASPKLRKVQYELEYSDRFLDDIPWSRLTSIDVIMRLEDLFKILPHCESLEELCYTDPLALYVPPALPEREERPPQPLPHVTVPLLRRLRMIVTFAPNDMFEHLTLPALRSIYWRQNNVWFVNPDPNAFTDLLTRSYCPLKRFSYRARGGPQGEDVLSCILASPSMWSVEEVTAEVRFSNDFSKIMTNSTQKALPNLQVLSFVRCNMSPGVLGNMIAVMKLEQDRKSFRLFNTEFWPRHEEDRAKFAMLRKEGMTIID